jgi:hypothetical protein
LELCEVRFTVAASLGLHQNGPAGGNHDIGRKAADVELRDQFWMLVTVNQHGDKAGRDELLDIRVVQNIPFHLSTRRTPGSVEVQQQRFRGLLRIFHRLGEVVSPGIRLVRAASRQSQRQHHSDQRDGASKNSTAQHGLLSPGDRPTIQCVRHFLPFLLNSMPDVGVRYRFYRRRAARRSERL